MAGTFHLNESLLIRDTLYLMQGISGKYVRFASSSQQDKRLVFPSDSVCLISQFMYDLFSILIE